MWFPITAHGEVAKGPGVSADLLCMGQVLTFSISEASDDKTQELAKATPAKIAKLVRHSCAQSVVVVVAHPEFSIAT